MVLSAPTHVRNVVIKGGADSTGRIPARLNATAKDGGQQSVLPGCNREHDPRWTQSCVWRADYTGQVTCLQTSNSATVVQTCDASQTQTIPNRNNTAVILQVIISIIPRLRRTGPRSSSFARRPWGLDRTQRRIAQYIKQSLGPGTPEDTEEGDSEPDAAATMSASQKQESHQTVHLSQSSEQGNNNAPVLQFLRQRERKAHADTTNQDQNIDSASEHPASVCQNDPGSDALPPSVVVDPNANQCILSNQTSVSGKQNLWLRATTTTSSNARERLTSAIRYKAFHSQGAPITG